MGMTLSAIELKNLSYSYPDGHQALNQVSLTIARGERVALVGPNGAGKSTLLLHLNGILEPQQGQVYIGTLPVKHSTLPQIRAAVGLVFQDPNDQLFSPTVFDDVAYGPLYQGLSGAEVRERVQQALSAVHMEAYAPRTSYNLSIGEKKRIAIATVLAMAPQTLVFDEPTAGIDPRARRSLITLLRELPQTIIAATHDMRLVAEFFPRSILMDEGCVVADGATAELLADAELLTAHGLVE